MAWYNNLFGGKNISVKRDREGNWSYWLDGDADLSLGDKLEHSIKNPALFTAFDIRSTVFSRAVIKVLDDNDNEVKNDPILELFANPNFFESQQDFLKKSLWFKGLGTCITRAIPKRLNSDVRRVENIEAIEHLIPSAVNYGEASKNKVFVVSKKGRNSIEESTIKYDISGKEHEIPIAELVFFYDVACSMTKDGMFKSPSRVDAVSSEIKNIEQAQISKKKNLVFSAKWLATNQKKGLQGVDVNLEEEERDEIEGSLFYKSMNATNANVKVESLANDFTTLMLDDNISSDAMRIFGVYNIPRDVLNWWHKGQGGLVESGASQQAAVVNWIQNSIQVEADDFANTWTTFLNYREQKKRIVLDYSNLPIMQVLEKERIEGVRKQAEILSSLVSSGVSLDKALEISGLDEKQV